MATSHAVVATPDARRYLRMLCKHWGHKFEVVYDADQGLVPFSADAQARFTADEQRLLVVVTHTDGAQLPRLQDVIAEHLQRFALKETLAFPWTAGEPATH